MGLYVKNRKKQCIKSKIVFFKALETTEKISRNENGIFVNDCQVSNLHYIIIR